MQRPDEQRKLTVLFGGEDNSGSFTGDTWGWNGLDWTQLEHTGPARVEHAMAYDATCDRIVLFGDDRKH